MVYEAGRKRTAGVLRVLLISGAAAAAMVSGARAQTANDSSSGNSSSSNSANSANSAAVDTVVVTAQRRGVENVLNVPLAVDAFSGKTLQNYNINSLTDLTRLDSSLTVVNFGAGQQRIVIRGISSTTTATTGVYLDESPLLGPFNGNVAGDGTPSLRLHDVNDVEVLKGPQGTLFGASSMDGTLRVVTSKPNLETASGYAEVTGADVDHGDGLFNGTGTLNVPIIQDKAGLRIVGWDEQGGGYIDKIYRDGANDPHSNNSDLLGGRVSLRLEPIDHLTVDASVNYQSIKVTGPQYVTTQVGLSAASFLARPAGAGPYTNFDPTADFDRENYQLYSAVADYDLGFGDIIASGSDGRRSFLDAGDTSGTACGLKLCSGSAYGYPAIFTRNIYYDDHTAELRFSSKFGGPFQIVAGGFYEDTSQDYNGAALQASPINGLPPCQTYLACVAEGLNKPGLGNSPVIFANADQFDTTQYAAYGQIDYKILPTVTLTAGARYFSAHLTDQATNQQSISPDYLKGVITVPSTQSVLNATQTKPTYNAAVNWKPSQDFSVYVRAASGFRIGGINNDASVAAQAGTTIPNTYAPDSLWDYEIGTKFYLINHTLSVDASYYHIDWSGQQINATAGGTFSYELNAGLTRTNGVELNSTYKPITGLTLGGSITFVDSRLAENLPANAVVAGTPGLSGDRVPYQPQLIFAGRAEYEKSLNDNMTGYIQSDFNFRGSSYTAFRNPAPGGKADYNTLVPDYVLANARVGVRFDRYDVSIFAQNIANEYAVLGAATNVSSARQYTAPPRTVGVRVSANF